MNDYKLLHNGRHTRCAETVITLNGNGEVTSSCNPDYVPNDTEFDVCRNLGIIENGTDPVLVEEAKFKMRESNYNEVKKRRLTA
ncbi:MAG: hypothetical protein E7508_03310 [Ruminococcus sp.]|nr:hypothetical protein [Ruminococcus sp.]